MNGHNLFRIGMVGFMAVASRASAAQPEFWHFNDDRLDNGLRVITLEDHRTPLANVQVWYHVGSKDEDPERQGFAHMFEHMMFRGTDRIGPQDHFKYLNRYGARVNGYTSFDMTVYWETLPASQVDLALWLEAERMGRLKINEAYFAAEREVVKEERRMRYLNRPYGKLYETLFGAAFEKHPYRWTPIGNMPHLDAASTDELVAFFKTFYVPNNATLVVVGDVSHAAIMDKVEEYFGKIPAAKEPPRVSIVEPPMTGPRRVEIKDKAPSPRIEYAFHAPSDKDDDAIPLNMLTRILSSGQSSRLYRHLVSGKELAVSAYAYDYTLEQAGLFVFSLTLKPDVSVEEGEKALREEIALLLEEGIGEDELEKARNQAVAEDIRKGQTVQGRADQLGYAAVVLDDVNRVNTDLQRKRAVTAEQVMAVARRVLRENNRVEVITRPDPNPPTEAETSTDHARKTEEELKDLPRPADMPRLAAPKIVDLPFPDLKTLDNGLRVAVFRDPSIPAVSVSFCLLTGAKEDPADLAGLASVTSSTLRRGTRAHSGEELAKLIDFHAMSLSDSVDHDDTTVSLWTLSEHLELAVKTLAEVVRYPTFPDAEIRNYVGRAAAGAAISEKDPSTVASRALAVRLFEGHHLAKPDGGTSVSLRGIDRAKVAEFHEKCYAPNVGCLLFAGDVTPDEAFDLAREFFGDWEARAEPARSVRPTMGTQTRILLVDKPDATQSELRIGQVVDLDRRHPDYAPARLLSQLFGESFNGRLNRVLRVEKGLTYGASGYFDVEADAASFKISTFTRTQRTAEAVEASLEQVRELLSDPPSEGELSDARDTLIGRFQMALETPAQIAARWWDLQVWDLPERWYTDYFSKVASTKDPAVLTRVAKELLRPDRLEIVVVGNGQEIAEQLEKIAPVERVPVDTAATAPAF